MLRPNAAIVVVVVAVVVVVVVVSVSVVDGGNGDWHKCCCYGCCTAGFTRATFDAFVPIAIVLIGIPVAQQRQQRQLLLVVSRC